MDGTQSGRIPSRRVQIAQIPIGGGAPLCLIAGPCVLEDSAFNLRWSRRLAQIAGEAGFPLILKASFDKANRTKKDSPRGPGIERGLDLLAEIKADTQLPVLTDVHTPEQCAAAATVADVLQIPAFLCRQTDLLAAAGETGRAVNIKKGQFMAAEDMAFAVEKCGAGARVLLTERGTTFGYHDLVVDFRNLEILSRFAPVVFDGTHAVQRPGAGAGTTGGDRRQVPALVRAAVAAGVDVLFLEAHPDPDRAPSDGPNSLDDRGLLELLAQVRAIRSALAESKSASLTQETR